MASRIQRELALLLTGKDISASKAVKGVSSSLKDLNKAGRTAGAAVARNIERGAVIGATAAVGAVGYAVKQAMDWEAQLNVINTIAREDAAGLQGIGESIRKEARESGTALEDLAAGYYDLLSAGVKAADAPNVLHKANTLAIGGLSTTSEAVDLLTTAINTYGGDASKAGQFTDEFAKAIERGKVTAADLAASYASVGPLAASLGVENKELAAGYARLTAGGTQAGEASTQMAAALTALLKKSSGMKKLEKDLKKNYAAIAGKQGLNVAYQQLRDDAAKAGVEVADLLGRKEAYLYLLQTTGENQAAYNADLAAMGDAAGTAAEQMGERQQGLAFQINRLKANVKDAAITIGTQMLPILADLAEDATGWITDHQAEIASFGKDLAAGLRDAVTWAKSLDWDAIGAGLGIAAQAGKTLIDAFTSAPPWLQGFLTTGFLANKFTGGAVMDVAGILLGQVVRGVLGMQAGVVYLQAGVVNGPGAGGPTPAPGGPPGKPGGPPGKPGRPTGPRIGGGAAFSLDLQSDVAPGLSRVWTQIGENAAAAGLAGVAAGARDRAENPLAFGQFNRNAPQSRGGLSPDERQARNDQAKIGLLLQRAGERGGAAQEALEREQSAVARFQASASPSLSSMKAHLAVLESMQRQTPARDAAQTAAIVAAIRTIRLEMEAPQVTVVNQVTARSVTTAQTRHGRVANRPPGRGPTID